VPTTAFDQRATTEEDVELSVVIQADDPILKKPLWRDTIKASASFANILIGQLLDRHEAQQRRDKKKNNTKE